MAEAGQELGGFGGMKLLLVRTGEETGGELLEMEATYTGEAGMPPEHLHPNQAQHFEVIDGSMRAIVGGEERVDGPGESFDVPAGTPAPDGCAGADADEVGGQTGAPHGGVLR